MISLREIRAQVRCGAICTDCHFEDDCLEKYPDIGCPAFRFLRRIAEGRR